MKKRGTKDIIVGILLVVVILGGVFALIFFVGTKKGEKTATDEMMDEKTEASSDEGEVLTEFDDFETGEDDVEEEDGQEDALASYEENREWHQLEDTDLKISYEVYSEDEEKYYFDKELSYMGYEGDDGFGVSFLVSFSEDVSALCIWELTSTVNEDGELSVAEYFKDDRLEELDANEPIVISVSDIGETLPVRGISFKDENGKNHHMYLQISGEDGSAIATEYDYSYINAYFDSLIDDDLEMGHVKGFDSMQTAAENYGKTDESVKWPVLWIVVGEIDADGDDKDKNRVHQDVKMTQEEKSFYLYDMPFQFADTVNEFTDGLVKIEIETMLYDKVTTLSDWNCITPNDFDDETRARFLDYNSVVVCMKGKDDNNDKFYIDWLGLAHGIQDSSYGYCQVDVGSTYEYDRDKRNDYPAEPWIHEWQHTLQPLGLMFGKEIGDPDEAEKNGYKNEGSGPINGFFSYYRDVISGKIGGDLGITSDMWETLGVLFEQTRGRKVNYDYNME